jgi:hypothetical protein
VAQINVEDCERLGFRREGKRSETTVIGGLFDGGSLVTQ